MMRSRAHAVHGLAAKRQQVVAPSRTLPWIPEIDIDLWALAVYNRSILS
jgi:hypothetical protein